MTQLLTPIVCKWDGRVMQPGPKSLQRAQQVFTEGGIYNLVEHEEPSDEMRARYHALVQTAHANMHEALQRAWRNKDQLRWWSLTETEYCAVRDYEHSTEEEMQATKIALGRASKPDPKTSSDYFRIEQVDRPRRYTIKQFRPFSTRRGLMDKRTFLACSEASLAVICRATGLRLDKLEQMSRHTT